MQKKTTFEVHKERRISQQKEQISKWLLATKGEGGEEKAELGLCAVGLGPGPGPGPDAGFSDPKEA